MIHSVVQKRKSAEGFFDLRYILAHWIVESSFNISAYSKLLHVGDLELPYSFHVPYFITVYGINGGKFG